MASVRPEAVSTPSGAVCDAHATLSLGVTEHLGALVNYIFVFRRIPSASFEILTFRTTGTHLLNKERVGAAQLCSVEVLEFEAEDKPTNDDCLMRSVITPNFCKVCIEGLWLSLLRSVNLIDGIKERCEQQPSDYDSNNQVTVVPAKTLELELIPLAQFRESQAHTNETYIVKWWKDGKFLKQFTNQTRIALNDLESIGTYSISVTFVTTEVRVDKDNLLSTNFTYQITHTCESGPA
ncbi:hypothetical protein C0991_001800 [Blastosporella zonata]|nr:hypothetical protein C0991_001800 [Blastosporella zonata]